MGGLLRKLARLAVVVVGLLATVLGIVTLLVWQAREDRNLESAVLGEQRRLLVFNAGGEAPRKIIFVLDGERIRHGLATAVQARILAFLNGQAPPVVVGIDGQGSRDVDLRNRVSDPAEWRPSIAGRADRFDAFLLSEVLPQFTAKDAPLPEFHLFGHSLGGLYTLDLATRQQLRPGISGFAAFTPTLSHDRSVLDRLAGACRSPAVLLATIGLESDREHRLFDRAGELIARQSACRNSKVKLVEQPGMIHQVSMLSGQTLAIYSHVLD